MDTKRLLKNKTRYYIAICAISVFFFGYSSASAATLQISSDSTTLSPGDTVTLYVVLNSAGVAINNAEATIKFPTDLFDVVSISKNGSIFTLWVEEPSFLNSTGIIAFNGGVPTPGFVGSNGSVVSIVIKAKKAGRAEFIFLGAAVRANDGLGTDVLSGQQGKTITIVSKEDSSASKKESPAQEEQPTTSSGPALQISSLTHPNENKWYKDRNPVFQWVVPADSDAIQTVISRNASSIPRVTYIQAINKKAVANLEDGVWYFRVRARVDASWGSADTYMVRIDATPPQKKNVKFTYNDNSKVLTIDADIQDVTSGIDYYEIYLNNSLIKTISAKDFVGGKYSLGINASGGNTVKLLVVDRAGNSLESSGTFQAVGVLALELDPLPPTVPADEQLLIRGKTQNSNIDVTVNVKRDDDESVVLKTKSNMDGGFFVLTPKLKSGVYDIWAETGSGDDKVLSAHGRTQVISPLAAMLVPQLEFIPPTVPADEQLLVSGQTQDSNIDVAVYVKHDNDEPIILKTKSNSDGSFFVLTPKLKSGVYDIWAETGSGDDKVLSAHRRTEATSHLLITIGSFTITAFSLITPILAVLIFLVILAYYLGHHFTRFKHKQKMKTALVKGDNSKILLVLKKRLEKHLGILQHTRRGRILTKEEKKIKEAIEGDLDEVDKAIKLLKNKG